VTFGRDARPPVVGILGHIAVRDPGSGETTMDRRQRVVVGVDGSTESRDALLFALEEAVRRDADLTVVAECPVVVVRPTVQQQPSEKAEPAAEHSGHRGLGSAFVGPLY
jgi:hypothetical protein